MKAATVPAQDDTTAPDPVRQAFAEARQERLKADSDLDAARTAEGRAQDALRDAEEKVRNAAANVEAVMSEHTDATTAAVSSGTTPPSSDAIGEARLLEMAARDELTTAKEVLARLTAQREDIERSASYVEGRYTKTQLQVAGIEVVAFIKDTNKLQEVLTKRKLIIRELLKAGYIPFELDDGSRPRMEAINCLNARLLPHHEMHDHGNSHQWGGTHGGRFYRFLAALDEDPNAQIEPEGEDEQ